MLDDTEYVNNFQDRHREESHYSEQQDVPNSRTDNAMFSSIESAYEHMYPEDQAVPEEACDSDDAHERAHSSHSSEPQALEPTLSANADITSHHNPSLNPLENTLLLLQALMEPRFPALPQHRAPQPQLSAEASPREIPQENSTAAPQLSTEASPREIPQESNAAPPRPKAGKPIFPTPPQSQVTGKLHGSGPSQSTSNESLLDMLQRYITCSVCKTSFNRTPISGEYLIQLNRPIQCLCGCVLCTICYKDKQSCSVHGLVSYHGTVNTIVSNLANCCHLEKEDQWDLRRNCSDSFKTEAQVNHYVREIMNNQESPDCEELKSGEFL